MDLNLKLRSGIRLPSGWQPYLYDPRLSLKKILFFHLTSAGADFASCQDKEVIVDMTQSLDGEEAAAVVEDLVKADAMQWDMKLV